MWFLVIFQRLFARGLFVFFVKQETAYEVRISDWSSVVCSSDLRRGDRLPAMDHGPSICPRRSPDCLFDDTLSGGGRRRGAKRSAVTLRPGVPVGLGGGQHYPQRSLYLPSGPHCLVLDLVDGRGGKRPSRSRSLPANENRNSAIRQSKIGRAHVRTPV